MLPPNLKRKTIAGLYEILFKECMAFHREMDKISNVEIRHDLSGPIESAQLNLNYAKTNLTNPKKALEKIERTKLFLDYIKRALASFKQGKICQLRPTTYSKIVNFIKKFSDATYYAHSDIFPFETNLNQVNQSQRIFADEIGLTRVVANLLKNADLSNKKDDKIYTNIQLSKDKLRIVVSDSGNGMPSEKVEQFNSGKSVASSKAERRIGIGLRNVIEIVKAHNGTAKVTSHLGKGNGYQEQYGTTFFIEIPV